MRKLPKYAVYVRWDTFELNIVGRKRLIGILVWIGLLLGPTAIAHFF